MARSLFSSFVINICNDDDEVAVVDTICDSWRGWVRGVVVLLLLLTFVLLLILLLLLLLLLLSLLPLLFCPILLNNSFLFLFFSFCLFVISLIVLPNTLSPFCSTHLSTFFTDSDSSSFP